jgi:hypothetical protein
MECEIAAIDAVEFEARFIDNGELYYSRVFPTPELTPHEAAEKRAALLAAALAGTATDAGLVSAMGRPVGQPRH